MWSLGRLTILNFARSEGLDIPLINAAASLGLIGLAAFLTLAGMFKVTGERRSPATPGG